MTIEEMIAVLQAAKAGKRIQCRQGVHEWEDTDVLPCSLTSCDYRVKPEPLEVYGNVYAAGVLGRMYRNADDADSYAEAGRIRRAHFREVLPQ